jgi:hypothetical protein
MAANKIHPLALGLSLGIISGLTTFIMGLLAFILLNGKPLVSMLGTMYITYNPTLINGALGAAIVFINTVIAGYIFAWLYNYLANYM